MTSQSFRRSYEIDSDLSLLSCYRLVANVNIIVAILLMGLYKVPAFLKKFYVLWLVVYFIHFLSCYLGRCLLLTRETSKITRIQHHPKKPSSFVSTCSPLAPPQWSARSAVRGFVKCIISEPRDWASFLREVTYP